MMKKEVTYGTNLTIRYENLPVADSLRYLNTNITLPSMPETFSFVEDPNPPVPVVAPQEPRAISLAI